MKLWKLLDTHRRELSHCNGLMLRHPLLSLGCFLAPAVMVVNSLQNAVAFSWMLVIVSVPTYLVMSLIGRHIVPLLRIFASPVLASLFYIPAYYCLLYTSRCV